MGRACCWVLSIPALLCDACRSRFGGHSLIFPVLPLLSRGASTAYTSGDHTEEENPPRMPPKSSPAKAPRIPKAKKIKAKPHTPPKKGKRDKSAAQQSEKLLSSEVVFQGSLFRVL